MRGSHSARGNRWLVYGIGAFTVVAAAGVAAYIWVLPRQTLTSSRSALAQLSTSGIGGKIVKVSAKVDGIPTPVSLRTNGTIVPNELMPQGVKVTVTAVVQEPSWASLLIGKTKTLNLHTTTPVARLADDLSIGPLVRGYFSIPISRVAIYKGSSQPLIRLLPSPKDRVTVLGPSGGDVAGSIELAAAPLPWEKLGDPHVLTYFKEQGNTPIAVISPGTEGLTPSESITLTLNQRISQVFGTKRPTITPTIQGAANVVGRWVSKTPYSITFIPTQPDFWPGESFTLQLPRAVGLPASNGTVSNPTDRLTLTGVTPSVLRLQQMLAQLNYLPVSFNASSRPTSLANSVVSPIAGQFNWRFQMPSAFTSLWQPGTMNVITKGALMSFEQFNGLDTNGLANPLLWPTIVSDLASGKVDPHRYSWIEVSKVRPEQMWLYENGQVVLSSLVNTGIPGLNTPVGTWPIYLRFKVNYMSGTNPNGTHYHDLVHWINYFNGSVAVHGFVRASYGFPQSLGCVELPVNTAGVVYPQVHIGTLVTVLPS